MIERNTNSASVDEYSKRFSELLLEAITNAFSGSQDEHVITLEHMRQPIEGNTVSSLYSSADIANASFAGYHLGMPVNEATAAFIKFNVLLYRDGFNHHSFLRKLRYIHTNSDHWRRHEALDRYADSNLLNHKKPDETIWGEWSTLYSRLTLQSVNE
jgi:hypothetical protein